MTVGRLPVYLPLVNVTPLAGVYYRYRYVVVVVTCPTRWVDLPHFPLPRLRLVDVYRCDSLLPHCLIIGVYVVAVPAERYHTGLPIPPPSLTTLLPDPPLLQRVCSAPTRIPHCPAPSPVTDFAHVFVPVILFFPTPAHSTFVAHVYTPH